MLRHTLAAVSLLVLSAVPAVAGPRDELLRVAPADAAIVVVIQNAREHARRLAESPFAEWFPTSAVGKKLLAAPELKQFTAAGDTIFAALGTTPRELLADVLGDAVAFAYSPAPPGRPADERAILLIRPGKREVLDKLIAKLNELQGQGGEVKKVEKRQYGEGEYFARENAGGGSHYYCFRGDVFAFATSELDVRAFIDRDRAEAPLGEKVPELVARMKDLGVADAVGVVFVNPRALEGEVKAQVAAAGPEAKRFLGKFAEVWSALDSVAVYLALDGHAELGLSLRFRNEKLPPDAKKFLTGLREPSIAGRLIPEDALFGMAGHFRAADLIDLVSALAPVEPGKPGVKEWLDQTVGLVVDREMLPQVFDSLGPNWAAWVSPPQPGAFLPTAVAVVEVSGTGEDRAKTEAALLDGLQTAFAVAQVAYNASHAGADRIKLAQEKDPKTGAVIRSMINDKGFPPAFRPSFAIQKGYLVLATHPDAIRRFDPARPAEGDGLRTLARFSGTRSRDYFQKHGGQLAQFLHAVGAGNEAELKVRVADIADVLELIDSAELAARAGENTLRVFVRVAPAKPLKPAK